MNGLMALRRASALAAALACLALPASAQATEPLACLTPASLDNATEGAAHPMSGACSVDLDGQDIVEYEWDLDGDGTFETDTGASPVRVHTWTDRGVLLDARVNVGLRVTDSAGESGSTTEEIRVVDTMNSWILFEPQIVNPGDTIDLVALIPLSVDTVNPPWTFRWDLDGDGSYETDTGDEYVTTAVAPETLGMHRIGLQITDGLGDTSRVHRQIEVVARHPSRDMIPWEAPPVNRLDTSTLQVQAPPIAETTAPPQPVGETPAPAAEQPVAPPFIRISRLKKDPRGITVSVVGSPNRRFLVKVSIAAKVARAMGFGRRRIVYASGSGRIGSAGTGTVRMRWTAAGRRGFYARRHVMDIGVRLS
jgi:hypothetical protein